MNLFKRFGRRFAALGAIAATACAAAPAAEPKAASRPCGRSPTPTRPSICSAPSICCPRTRVAHADVRQGRRRLARGWSSKRSSTTAIPPRPSASCQAAAYPRACRRSPSGSARKAGGAGDGNRQVRHSAAGLDGWRPGRPRSCCWACSSRTRPRPARRRNRAQEAVHRRRQADRPAGNQRRAARLLRHAVRRRAARVPRRVLDDPATMKDQFSGMLDAWTRGDVDGHRRELQQRHGRRAGAARSADRPPQRQLGHWVKGRLDKPGTVMVAVGAGHLAGDKSVVKLLEKQGSGSRASNNRRPSPIRSSQNR